jgi:hypothetical protein
MEIFLEGVAPHRGKRACELRSHRRISAHRLPARAHRLPARARSAVRLGRLAPILRIRFERSRRQDNEGTITNR